MNHHPTIESLVDKLVKKCSRCPQTPCLNGYICPFRQELERQLKSHRLDKPPDGVV